MTEDATPPQDPPPDHSASAPPPEPHVWDDEGDDADENLLSVIGRAVVPPVLHDRRRRAAMGLPEDPTVPGRYMIELNIQYRGGLRAASVAFRERFARAMELCGVPAPRPVEISKSYYQCSMSVVQWRTLLKLDDDEARQDPGRRVIYKLWPDFKVRALVDRSVATVKADAAFRSYSASGAGITWAVIDSGIDGSHPHFGSAADPAGSVIHHPDVKELHYDFTYAGEGLPQQPGEHDDAFQERWDERARQTALVDDLGHGTHVAGIIAGGLPANARQRTPPTPPPPGDPPTAAPAPAAPGSAPSFAVYEQVFEADLQGKRILDGKLPVQRNVRNPDALRGVAPQCLLVSLKVLNDEGEGRVSDVMRALVYIREHLNDDPKMLRVHGVNLSVGYDFDAQMFACGQSPICVEVDRLVKSGVSVVAAAGNTGYGKVNASQRASKVGLSNTINDPGNAALAITVGATHRDAPHTYGVSYFSSKGPTGDGRLKPDLVAPGERITSCASGSKCRKLGIPAPEGAAVYIDDSGTSMAAPHVSGAIAAFLSIRREFIQRPEEVKRIFLASATSLGRERYFEGHGLVDLMRAIQSV